MDKIKFCLNNLVQRHRHPNAGASRQVLRVNLARLFACARIELHVRRQVGVRQGLGTHERRRNSLGFPSPCH
jgi:hypothetical protein